MTDKYVSLKPTAAERKAKEQAMADAPHDLGENEGLEMHMGHEHAEKLGLHDLPVGHEVHVHLKGHVVGRSEHEGEDGHTSGHVRLRFHHGKSEHEEPEERKNRGVRDELEKNYSESEKRGGKKDADGDKDGGTY